MTDLKVDAPVVTAGATPLVRGVVRNFGPSKADGVLVRLVQDGRVSSEQSLDLPVGEDVPVIFNQTFATAGDHVVELTMDSDALPLDDRRWLVVPVRDSLNVLLVDGSFRSEPFQAETDYLAQACAGRGLAWSARHDPLGGGLGLAARAATCQTMTLWFCATWPSSARAEVAALEDYLKQGGGLIVFGGDQVIADNYNRLLYADGKGLLPAAIGPAMGDAAKKQAAFAFNPLGYRHPLVAEFRGEADPVTAGLTLTSIWQYHKLKLPPESTAQIAVAFDTGDPAVVECARARGRVILVATSADTGWNSWPLHNSYPPVMQQMILQAAAGRLAERNIKVGQPYDQSFPAAGAAATVTVTNPKGQPAAARLKGAGGFSELHFTQTELSGPYQLRIGPPLALESTFAADPDPAESNLAKLDRPPWNSGCPAGVSSC